MEAIQKLDFEVSKSTCVLSCENRAKEVVEMPALATWPRFTICGMMLFWALMFLSIARMK